MSADRTQLVALENVPSIILRSVAQHHCVFGLMVILILGRKSCSTSPGLPAFTAGKDWVLARRCVCVYVIGGTRLRFRV
jgi:hypothetical protein